VYNPAVLLTTLQGVLTTNATLLAFQGLIVSRKAEANELRRAELESWRREENNTCVILATPYSLVWIFAKRSIELKGAVMSGNFDANFVFRMFVVMSSGVLLTILGFIVLGVMVFKKNDPLMTREFLDLFSKGDVLRLLTVGGILVVIIALAFAKLIQGEVVASILSGVTGYVLGGLSGGKPTRVLANRRGDGSHGDVGNEQEGS
jgi:amino acid transporter